MEWFKWELFYQWLGKIVFSFEESNSKEKNLGLREIIAISLDSNIRKAEFKVEIHNLRDRVI